MDKYFKWKVLLILLVVGLSVYFVYPPQEKVHLGLDLKGGIHLLLQVEIDKVDEKHRAGAVDRAVEVIKNRIDQLTQFVLTKLQQEDWLSIDDALFKERSELITQLIQIAPSNEQIKEYLLALQKNDEIIKQIIVEHQNQINDTLINIKNLQGYSL